MHRGVWNFLFYIRVVSAEIRERVHAGRVDNPEALDITGFCEIPSSAATDLLVLSSAVRRITTCSVRLPIASAALLLQRPDPRTLKAGRVRKGR